MNRRQFLKAAQLTAIGALVASAYPPTAWGRYDQDLYVSPKDVGLTASDQASVTAAVGLSAGTELFQDTIYAQQVVSPEAVGTHALIEGRSSRLRAQSVLDDNDPLESQFLDTDYHFGPPELVQLEKVGNGWELVHYYHSGAARSDGAKTDGLVRHVIIEGASLVNPTKVLTITGTNSNRFGANGDSQSSQVAYVVFVEDPTTSPNNFGGLVAVGRISVRIDPPYTATADASYYPLEWGFMPLNEILGDEVVYASDIPEYQSCGTYTRNAYQDSATYDAAQATEHIVLYYADTSSVVRPIQILSLIDIPAAGTAIAEAGNVGLKFSGLPLPTGYANATGPWRVINIDWDPTNPDGDEYYRFTDVTVATSYHKDNGDPVLVAETITPSGADIPVAGPFSNLQGASFWTVVYDAGNKYLGSQPDLVEVSGSGVDQFDFSTIGNVHTLFSGTGNNPYYGNPGATAPYRVVLASFASANLAMFVLGPSDYTETTDVTYAVQALFPVALPDAAGVGTITNVAGGTSKFGGLRFVASDEDGNVFLLRQQRAQGTDTPYPPPVYGPFDSSGMARTDWNTTGYDSLPSSTSSASPLNDLATWTLSFNAPSYAPPYVAYNMLLSALVGFGTTSSNETQGTWLGNNYQAAYALSRFGYDSVHVVVKAAQGGTPGSYAAYTMFCNPLTRTWHQRMIAQQVTPQPPGENESGDHFQATVIPVNAYGEPVSMTAAENAGLNIEVRADVPTTVVDDTHNLYYNIDQYSSFMAAPDPLTGNLALVVKAETFAQVLYVRLVETSALTPSGGDSALLKSITETIFPWVTINMAAQAQARMGNTKDSAAAAGTGGQTPDTTVYVSGDSLTASNSQTPWSFKGSYSPSQSNMGDLGSYLNTSGQNMLLVTSQTTGTTADGDPVNPLTTLTAVSTVSLTPGTTSFGYADGTITHSASAPAPGNVLGGIWSGINHALHDALQWLQHVEGEVYKELASDGVTLAIAVDNITVTVSKDIMKQVNGLEEDLEQVVTTVEEYANVVVNVLVSIVEDSFLYQFIELLIALISLFLYFGDVLDLSKSFKNLFQNIINGVNGESIPQLPASFSAADDASQYLGPNNSLDDALGGLNSGSIETELTQGLLDVISGNPLTKKIINKVMAAISDVLDGKSSTLPLSFQMDPTLVQSITNDIKNLETNLVTAVANMVEATTVDLIETLAADVSNPRQTYNNLASVLGPMTAEIASDALSPVFDFVDSVAGVPPTFALNMIGYDDYVTLKIPMLADLCKLFGIGTVSGSNLKLSAHEAVFFPLALIVWVAVYEQEGRSISSVDALEGTFATAPGSLGAVNTTLWNYVRLAVDGILSELGGGSWTAKASMDDGGSPSQAQQIFAAAGVWFNWIRWMNDFIYYCVWWNPNTDPPWDFAFVSTRLATACTDVAVTIPGKNLNAGNGWPSDPRLTDVSQCINFLVLLVIVAIDTRQVVQENPNTNEIVAAAGQDIHRSQLIAVFLYNLFSLKEYLEYFAAYILTAPFGFSMQIQGLSGSVSATAPGEGQNNRRRRQQRRPYRRHRPWYRRRWWFARFR